MTTTTVAEGPLSNKEAMRKWVAEIDNQHRVSTKGLAWVHTLISLAGGYKAYQVNPGATMVGAGVWLLGSCLNSLRGSGSSVDEDAAFDKIPQERLKPFAEKGIDICRTQAITESLLAAALVASLISNPTGAVFRPCLLGLMAASGAISLSWKVVN